MRKRNRSGISLIEALVAAGLLSMITVMAYGLMSLLFKSNERNSNDLSLRTVADVMLTIMSQNIGNAILLTPPEGLTNSTDGLYPGVSAVTTGVPSECTYQNVDANSDQFSVLRVTSFENRQAPEVLLQAWDDATMDVTDVRISVHPADTTPIYTFQIQAPVEAYLVDANALAMRRFLVGPSTVTAGAPSYRDVKLLRPQSPNGVAQQPAGFQYIAGSFFHAARTKYYCRSTTGNLISKDEATGTVQTLLTPAQFKRTLSRLEFRFYGTQPAVRADASLFGLFPFANAALRLCMNSVMIRMELDSINPAFAPESYTRIVSLAAFNTRRPASCL